MTVIIDIKMYRKGTFRKYQHMHDPKNRSIYTSAQIPRSLSLAKWSCDEKIGNWEWQLETAQQYTIKQYAEYYECSDNAIFPLKRKYFISSLPSKERHMTKNPHQAILIWVPTERQQISWDVRKASITLILQYLLGMGRRAS